MIEPLRITSLDDLPGKCGRLIYECSGIDLHLNFRPAGNSAAADTLLIGFHGSIDRANRPTPAFIPFLPDLEGLHQLTVADPSLRTGSEIAMSWFAGDRGFDAQRLLPDFFKNIAKVLGVRRTIYFGTSGGGFAALYYSRQHRGSLALVGNPQTNIAEFYQRHVSNYLSYCWPGVSSISELAGLCETDLAAVYAGGEIDNYVVYLQNSTDAYHVHGHMAPFLSSIRNAETRKRITSVCFFPGKLGHSPIWEMFSPWLKSVVIATDWMAETITTTHHTLIATQQASPELVSSTKVRTTSLEEQPAYDLSKAALLRDYHLRQLQEAQNVNEPL